MLGGYNPSGWSTSGAAKNDIAAFLFVWPEGDVSERPIKLPRVRGFVWPLACLLQPLTAGM